MNPKEIIDGWFNLVKDKLDILNPELKEIAEQRIQICNVCELRRGNRCDPKKCIQHKITKELKCGCGCNLSAKAMSRKSQCPTGQW